MADYKKICNVAVVHEGLPVELRLQKREDQEPRPYYCLCWRTRYASDPVKSRRFYSSSKTGFWTIPVSVALELLRKADDKGFLHRRFDDLRFRDGSCWSTTVYSKALSPKDYSTTRDTIICNSGEPDWGEKPIFVICHGQGPDGAWREIMIVDSQWEFCTFRCTTTIVEYQMGIFADRLTEPWRLDNAMQDASAASIREFLRVLEELHQ